ncbi:tropinone reductase 2-like protein [Leptotrombidium deliense]|uniref:Tropinone reductase 2-like protein n=1 Tax=Leptotrombidium deliense TaxID=299467 RepID=A0A443SBK8_9ACAR|nr:tropinone reductase 2-like protein [Leptotrombidium deliense]
MLKFAGKVAAITGATSGIGKETATLFSKLGCRIAITGRNADNLKDTKQKCIASGLKENDIVTVVGDVTDEKFCKHFIDDTVKHFGQLNVLVSIIYTPTSVNSAGILRRGTAETTDLELYEFLFKTNVRSVCVYNMTKAAVDQLTRSAALELAADGIRVNAVNPGVTVTHLHKNGGMNEEEYAKFLEHSKTTHALGRAGRVDEIANSIAFLASDEASFITGVSLPVDGGRHQLCPR